MDASLVLGVVLTLLLEADPGHSVEEMIRIADSVHNRFYDKKQRWGATWQEVIWRKNQYSCWRSKSQELKDLRAYAIELKETDPEGWHIARTLAENLLNGTYEPMTEATHFCRKELDHKGLRFLGESTFHKWYKED